MLSCRHEIGDASQKAQSKQRHQNTNIWRARVKVLHGWMTSGSSEDPENPKVFNPVHALNESCLNKESPALKLGLPPLSTNSNNRCSNTHTYHLERKCYRPGKTMGEILSATITVTVTENILN
eukprot:5888986-Amphidinium_carterae.1